MTAKFKALNTSLIAKAIGSEVGNITAMTDTMCTVEFLVYGASFSLGIENFDIIDGESVIDIRPTKPADGFTWNGSKWVEPTAVALSISQQKALGKLYKGVQVPLDSECQHAVVAIGLQVVMGAFVRTVLGFSNGSSLALETKADAMEFIAWFSIERGKFFV